jgi:hypothetical protein
MYSGVYIYIKLEKKAENQEYIYRTTSKQRPHMKVQATQNKIPCMRRRTVNGRSETCKKGDETGDPRTTNQMKTTDRRGGKLQR